MPSVLKWDVAEASGITEFIQNSNCCYERLVPLHNPRGKNPQGNCEAMNLACPTQSIIMKKCNPEILALLSYTAEVCYLSERKYLVEGEPSVGLHIIETFPSNLNC
jgi:hypothetical protein